MRVWNAAVLVGAMAVLGACKKDSTGPTTPPLTAVAVAPATVTLAIGGTRQFAATGTDINGNEVTPLEWVWTSTSGTINATGLFTAGMVLGTFTNAVAARTGAISGYATVTVIAGPLATITVAPTTSTLAINGTQQFTAVGKDAGGNVLTITPTWSIVAGGGAITSAGLFTAGTVPGTYAATVNATVGSVSGTATVVVTVGALATVTVAPTTSTLAINGTQQFTAVGKDAGGNVLTITPTWSVVAGGGAISSAGLFTAGTVPGTYTGTVQATAGGISGTATVVVTVGALATVTVAPTTSTLAINGTQQFTAVGKDAGGNVLTITPTWSLVAGGGAITSAGLFTAGTVPGTYTGTVQAAVGSISGTATVVVTVGSVATIAVTPASPGLVTSATQQFTAVAKDAGGNVVTGSVVWSVVAGGGTINSTGLFTAGTVAGIFLNTVQAAMGTVFGTATVSVTASGGGPLGPAVVPLGTAGNFVILAKSAISNVPTSAITGDLGLSPAAASFITGFSLILPAGGAFSTSSQVTGNIYAADYAVPTPSNMTTAIGDMQTAYTDAAGRPTPDYVELATGNIGGLTLPPGLYKWSNTVTIPADVTLQGGANDVWIFQIGGGITQASATRVNLTGGAQAKNVFWQSFGVVDIGTTAHMEGIVLSQTSITLHTGATATGRLLAQTAVTLAGSTVVGP